MRITAIVALSLAIPAWAMAATPAPTPSPAAHSVIVKTNGNPTSMAPADQYFGSFGMSPLSIRSSIGFLGRQYHYRTISDHDLLRKALMTEDALRKWRSAYPADPWLAPTFFHLEQLYQAVQTDEARKHAMAILKDTVRYFPNSKEGHLSRARLVAGFPALVPETPLVSPSPTAEPSATPSDTSSPEPPATASGAPGGPATPLPPAATPAPMSSASPAPSSAPK